MLLLFLLGITAHLLSAQPTIVSGPVVDSVTYSSARITWITDAASTNVIYYGRDDLNSRTTSPGRASVHSWYLSGLAPATTYRYKVCSAMESGGAETCSDEQTLTTAAGGEAPLPPEPPRRTVDVSMPSGSWGEPFVAGSDCSALQSIFARIAELEDELNYEIQLAPRTYCIGQFEFPARPRHKGWIVVKSTGSLPPEGVRVGPDSVPEMVPFITDALPATRLVLANLPASCSPGSLVWTSNTPGMSLLVCSYQGDSGGPKTISDVSYSGSDPVVVNLPGHGYRTGNIVRIADTGLGVDNQNWRITVLDDDHFTLDGARGSRNYKGGGTAIRNDNWSQAPHREGTELPASCSPNDWFFHTGISPAAEAAFWCTAENHWTRVRAISTVSGERMAAIQLAPGAARYRFIGLEVTHISTPNPPPPGWDQRDYRQGVFTSLVATHPTSDSIIFDRCDIHGLNYPSRAGHGFYLSGSNVAIINSRIHKINRWTERPDGVNLESNAINVTYGPGPGHIENNYLESIGITVFFPDSGRNSLPAADYVIRRNVFAKPVKYLYGSPANVSGKNYMNRHSFELKMGLRIVVEGNIFDGNWADVNQGAVIALTPRHTSLSAAKKITSIDNGVITMDDAGAADPFSPGMLVHVQDSGPSGHDGIWEVDEILSPVSFRIKNPPAGAGSSGRVVGISSNMQISDVDIRNNVFRHAPHLILITGHHDAIGTHLTTRTTQRIRLLNNLVYDMDARPASEGGRISPVSSSRNGRSGIAVFAAWGMEDLIMRNNTMADFKGQQPTLLFFDRITGGAHAGLDVRDNIFTADTAIVASISTGFPGVESLNRQWTHHPNPAWTFKGNIVCCRLPGNGSSSVPAENSATDDVAEIGFLNPHARVFQLGLSSRFHTAGETGGSPGVDFNALESALGQSLELFTLQAEEEQRR